jgi:hypothetical protein
MKSWAVGAAGVVAACGLAGCGAHPARTASHHGRYVGIGAYSAGALWSKMAVANPPRDPSAAKTADDEHVIVVVDSDTGEIRQCGDLSGYCIGMNPWAKPLSPSQGAPVALTAHADQPPAK